MCGKCHLRNCRYLLFHVGKTNHLSTLNKIGPRADPCDGTSRINSIQQLKLLLTLVF